MTEIDNCYAEFLRIYKKFIFETVIFKFNNCTTTLFVFIPVTQYCGFRMRNRLCRYKQKPARKYKTLAVLIHAF